MPREGESAEASARVVRERGEHGCTGIPAEIGASDELQVPAHHPRSGTQGVGIERAGLGGGREPADDRRGLRRMRALLRDIEQQPERGMALALRFVANESFEELLQDETLRMLHTWGAHTPSFPSR